VEKAELDQLSSGDNELLRHHFAFGTEQYLILGGFRLQFH